MSEQNKPGRARRRIGRPSKDIWACGLILCFTVLVYASALFNGFVNFDDGVYVSRNEAVKSGLTFQSIQYAWTTTALGNWIPLTWMSYELDTTLFGTFPAGYIFTNIVLHASNCLLLYVFLRRATGQIGPSCVVALLYAVHPQHVESVAWIAERKDVLSTFFLLLSLHAWVSYARQPGWKYYLLTVVVFVLGLLAKPMLVTLPLLLIVIDYWPLERLQESIAAGSTAFRRLVTLTVEKIPMLLISFVFGLITISSQAKSGAIAQAALLSSFSRIANCLNSFTSILRQTFLPTNLTPYYALSEPQGLGIASILSIAILLSISGITLLCYRRRPYLLSGWCWFVISLLPVSGLLQVGAQAYADRYSYVPHIGLFFAAVWTLFSIPDEWKFAPLVKWGTVTIAMCFLTPLAFLQVGYWRNETSLWTHTLSVNEANWMAHHHLGRFFFEHGRSQEALRYFLRAEELSPDVPDVQQALSVCFEEIGDSQHAIEHSISALELNLRSKDVRLRLARLLFQENRVKEAIAILKDSLKYFPNEPDFLVGLGNVEMADKNYSDAAIHLGEFLRLKPSDTVAATLRAACLVELKRLPEAIEQLKQILLADPGNLDTRLQLADLSLEVGELAEAHDQIQRILRVDPANADALQLQEKIRSSKKEPAATPQENE